MRPDLLVAEDDATLAWLLMDRLARFHLTARVTDCPQEARRWIQENSGPLVLDGSVFQQMDIPLEALPRCVIIWSGDDQLVERGRQVGVKSVRKHDLEGLDRMLRDIAGAVEAKT